jgi:hypothetical protein
MTPTRVFLLLAALAASTQAVVVPSPDADLDEATGFWICADEGADMFDSGCKLKEAVGNATIEFGAEKRMLHVRDGAVLDFSGAGPAYEHVSSLPGTVASTLTPEQHQRRSSAMTKRANRCVNQGRLGNKMRQKGKNGRNHRFDNCKPSGSVGSESAAHKGAHNCQKYLGGTHYLCCVLQNRCLDADGRPTHPQTTGTCHAETVCSCDPVSRWVGYHGGECFRPTKENIPPKQVQGPGRTTNGKGGRGGRLRTVTKADKLMTARERGRPGNRGTRA